jgi:subtilisin family serine protease
VPSEELAASIADLGGFSLLPVPPHGEVESSLDDLRERTDVEVGTHVYFSPEHRRPVVPTGIIYCTPSAGASRAELSPIFELHGLRVVEWEENGPVTLSVTERSRNPLRVAAALQGLAIVASAEPDIDVPLRPYFSEPRDGLLSEQWYLDNDGSIPVAPSYPLRVGADAGVREAWRELGSLGESDLTIAVIDNGFDRDHPDLSGRMAHPLTVANNQAALPQGRGAGSHGTPCASIAVAPANGRGIVGAAPNARLMPIQGLTYSAYLTERMFRHCADRGAAVINCSWGTTKGRFRPGRFHERAIRHAITRGRNGLGCVVIFAVGNEGKYGINLYARIPGVIGVGASTSNDTHAPYSNRGPGISVVAPSDGGWPVLAARASWDPGLTDLPANKRYYVDGVDRGPHYKHFGGTSAAAPLVAGICALILTARPGLTATEVKALLERTADKIGGAAAYDRQGYSERFGYGRVNALRAVREVLTPSRPPTPSSSGAGELFRVKTRPVERKGYGLQISALSDRSRMLQLTAKLEAEFDQPVIVGESGGLYRVVLGSFTSAGAAREFIPTVRARGYEPFLRDLASLS